MAQVGEKFVYNIDSNNVKSTVAEDLPALLGELVYNIDSNNVKCTVADDLPALLGELLDLHIDDGEVLLRPNLGQDLHVVHRRFTNRQIKLIIFSV